MTHGELQDEFRILIGRHVPGPVPEALVRDLLGIMSDIAPFPCSSCERDHALDRPVTWDPVFAAWLCPFCRTTRTDAELGATRQANAAAALRGDAA